MNKTWLVYLLVCADNSYYCGVTSNLPRRIAQHNGQLRGGAHYTASRRPVRLLAHAVCANRSNALKLEYALKQLPKPAKLRFFQSRT